jgi:hypothetical protein
LFLDDDVIPDDNILDAYIGGIKRFPDAKVLAGMTTLPEATNTWTTMLRVCNVGYFYGVSKLRRHPPWAVTANLLVRGSRFNPTIQFKECYPKTGGGEDIDLVYQYKAFYPTSGLLATAAVPEAIVKHPWWNGGNLCYKQIRGINTLPPFLTCNQLAFHLLSQQSYFSLAIISSSVRCAIRHDI